MKIPGAMRALLQRKLSAEVSKKPALVLMNESQRQIFVRGVGILIFGQAHIGNDQALRNAAATKELRVAIELGSRRGEPPAASGLALAIEA